jgi:hypothetical protein
MSSNDHDVDQYRNFAGCCLTGGAGVVWASAFGISSRNEKSRQHRIAGEPIVFADSRGNIFDRKVHGRDILPPVQIAVETAV